MQIKPYIGVTGVTTPEQALELVEIIGSLGLPRSRKLMIGALMSYRGLSRGELANPSQYIFPDQIDEVFPDDNRVFNLVHYNSRAEGLYSQIRDVVSRVTYADGVQLNIAWPEPKQLTRLRSRAYTAVVLQISMAAYRMVAGRPSQLVAALQPYYGLVDCILVDPSGGTGRRFDRAWSEDIIGELVKGYLPMRLGIAGGLGPDNLDCLVPLLRIYPDLSWDAQARLRNDKDQLDVGRCRAYLEASIELVRWP